jgi:hypothetical protein
MKYLLLLVIGTSLGAAPNASRACSVIGARAVEFEPHVTATKKAPPVAPPLRVAGIRRGTAGDGSDTCSDIGVITFEMPANRKTRKLLLAFETIQINSGEVTVHVGPSPGFEYEGQIRYSFPWVDGGYTSQEPIDIVVKVTPFWRTGEAGEPVNMRVTQDGR